MVLDLPPKLKDRLHDMLGGLLPHPAACRAAAELLRNTHPHLTPPALAREAVKSARKWALATGAAWNWFEVRAVCKRAIHYHLAESVAAPESLPEQHLS